MIEGSNPYLPEDLYSLPMPPDISLEFTERGEGWPPRPRDQQHIVMFEAQEVAGSVTDDLERHLRALAVQDERVNVLLGDRFAHITSDAITGKGHKDKCSQPLSARLVFFSHTNNVAVEVITTGSHVESANRIEGYRPREGLEEITEAICLARADKRLKEHVQLLAASAILLHPTAESVGEGHRMMWVTFVDSLDTEDEQPALFSATVDLTSQFVLMARKEPHIPSREDCSGGSHHAE